MLRCGDPLIYAVSNADEDLEAVVEQTEGNAYRCTSNADHCYVPMD